jgi:Zn-finger nucleic acid-binding protein
MCIICEHQLYEEHRNAEDVPFDPCPDCGKFPSNEGQSCYHCFSVGNTIDECPECLGKPWSDDFLSAKTEIDNLIGSRSKPIERLKSLFSSANKIRASKD